MTIPDGVTMIDFMAFSRVEVTCIHAPDSLTSVDLRTFSNQGEVLADENGFCLDSLLHRYGASIQQYLQNINAEPILHFGSCLLLRHTEPPNIWCLYVLTLKRTNVKLFLPGW